MDYRSKEVQKTLKGYYEWFWHEYYGVDRQRIMRFFYGEEVPPDNIDHTLDVRRGLEKGILIPPVERPHNEVIKELKEVCKTVDMEDLVNGFLYSLSTGKNEYRTALASYLFAKGIKIHKHEHWRRGAGFTGCKVCGLMTDEKGIAHIEDSLSTCIMYYPDKYNSVHMQRADYALFDLKQFKQLPKVSYTKEDVDILVKILKLTAELGPENKYTALQKLITRSKFFKANGNEVVIILGVLSVCGVLQTPEHKGYLSEFTGYSERGFVGYETEIFYPLSYWHAKHGVNKDALKKVFPPCVKEAFEADGNSMSLEDVYAAGKDAKPSVSRAEEVFSNWEHIVELDNRRRHYFGLADLDPAWHKEVRYSVTHNLYKRTEVYFEGNTIKRVIYESKLRTLEGTFIAGEYFEREMNVETEDRYLLLPKTSRGKKKPWTASLLMNTLSYITISFELDLSRKGIRSFNFKTCGELPLPPFSLTGQSSVSSAIGFYTYADEFIRNLPENYEEVLGDFRGDL